jgi:hypothetical protein
VPKVAEKGRGAGRYQRFAIRVEVMQTVAADDASAAIF